jgi:hypothetical protein
MIEDMTIRLPPPATAPRFERGQYRDGLETPGHPHEDRAGDQFITQYDQAALQERRPK